MSAPSWFMAGWLAGAAAVLGAVLLWRAWREPIHRGRRFLLAGGITAAAAVGLAAGLSLAIDSLQATTAIASDAHVVADAQSPMTPPSSEMPSASMMSQILAMPRSTRTQSAEPMDQAATQLASRLERQGGTAADWNLLAQAYDFLGRPEDAQRARARAAQAGAGQPAR